MNALSFIAIVVIVCCFANPGYGYFRFGPNENLVIMSSKIDTIERWIALIVGIVFWSVIDVFIHSIGSPVLGFNVYNPDKKNINEFTKRELQFLTNTNSIISGAKGIIAILIAISQIDIALISLLAQETTSIIVTKLLLDEKTFFQPIIMDAGIDN